MNRTWWAAVAAVALCASGCATDGTLPLLQSGGQDFSNGATAASKVLSAEIDAAPDVERQVIIFRDLPLAVRSDTNWDSGFEAFACAGLDDGAASAAGLATATKAADIVGALSAKPSDKLGEVIASIEKYRQSGAPTLAMPKPPGTPRRVACAELVRKSLADLRSSKASAFGFPDVSDAAKAIEAVYQSAKALYTDLAKAEDASLREKLLRKFLNDPATNASMVAALGSCADYAKASFDAQNNLVPPSRCDDGMVSASEVQTLFDRRVSSTLVAPFVQYLDTREQNPPPAAHVYVERMETVRANLAEFDAIRTQSSPGDLALPIATAYLNLRRIADGKLTQEEKDKAFSAQLSEFYSLMSELYNDVSELKSKADSAKTAVQKL